MEEWKNMLKTRVENMVFSMQITDFGDVVKVFRERFQELTAGIEDSKDHPLISESSSEEHAEFTIFKFGLALHNDFESGEVKVTYKEEESSINIALIRVDKDFSTVRGKEENREYYLSPQAIDEMFKKAFEPIVS